jgi:hypothetical protein
MIQQQQQQQQYDLFHLAELSFFKLKNSLQYKEPPLLRQLFIRNVLLSSSQMIDMQEQQVWLDACFDELLYEEDEEMQDQPVIKQEEDIIVLAFSNTSNNTTTDNTTSAKQGSTTTIFFM